MVLYPPSKAEAHLNVTHDAVHPNAVADLTPRKFMTLSMAVELSISALKLRVNFSKLVISETEVAIEKFSHVKILGAL